MEAQMTLPNAREISLLSYLFLILLLGSMVLSPTPDVMLSDNKMYVFVGLLFSLIVSIVLTEHAVQKNTFPWALLGMAPFMGFCLKDSLMYPMAGIFSFLFVVALYGTRNATHGKLWKA